MKLGLQISSFTWPGGDAAIGETLAGICRTADDAASAAEFHSLKAGFPGLREASLEGRRTAQLAEVVIRPPDGIGADANGHQSPSH